MAVAASIKRVHVLKFNNGTQEVCTATLNGTYTTGGFTVNLTGVTAGLGSSPYGGAPVLAQWQSPLGYQYVSTFSGQVMTTKIFSAANTELANGATPEASVPVVISRRLVY